MSRTRTGAKASAAALWKRVGLAERQAALRAAAFPDDTADKRAARVDRARTDPLFFCRTYLRHYVPVEPAEFHGDWLRHLVEGRDTVAACPRGFAKSTVISFGGTLWRLVVARVPFGVLVCAVLAQAEEIVEAIAEELEGNALLQADFGEGYPLLKSRTPSGWGASVETRHGCRVQALGREQSYRGLKHRQHRPHYAVVDDPESDVEVRNDRRREETRRWLTGTLRLALEPKVGSIFVCQNFTHPDCLAAHIVQDVQAARRAEAAGQPLDGFRFRRWAIHVYSALREDGSSAWPARFPVEDLRRLEAEAPEVFALEMQQVAVAVGVVVFARDLCRYHDEDEFSRAKIVYRVLACDPSKGRTQRSDFSAILGLALADDGAVYVRIADLQRRPPLQIVADLFRHVVEFRPDVTVIEGVAFQEVLKDLLEAEMAARGLYPAIVTYDDRAEKRSRIERLSRPYADGALRFRRAGQGELLNQLWVFPRTRDHDDGPDALEMAWSRVQDRLMGHAWADVARGVLHGRRAWSRVGSAGLGAGAGAW